MKLFEWLYYEPKYMRRENITDKALTRSIVISVIGILFSMTSLFGLTWAWFSDSVVMNSNTITGANFDLEITVTEAVTDPPAVTVENGSCMLDPTKTYSVILKKKGTAKSGFCHLTVFTPDSPSATVYYTESIPQIHEGTPDAGTAFVFTVSGITGIRFTPMWGQYPENQGSKVISYGGALDPIAPDTAPPEEG